MKFIFNKHVKGKTLSVLCVYLNISENLNLYLLEEKFLVNK